MIKIKRLLSLVLCLILILCAGACASEESDRMLRWVFDLETPVQSNDDLPFMGLDIPRSAVYSVTFLNTPDAPQDAVDYSANHGGGVLAWARHNGAMYNVYVAAEGGVIANPNSSYLFYGCTGLTKINFNGCFDTGNTTAVVSMFENCESLEKLDLLGLDLSRVTDASYMFWGCSRLMPPRMDRSNLDFASANTRNMFSDKMLVCQECSGEFIFAGEDRLFYAEKDFQNEPSRCPECREARREQNSATPAPKRMMEIHPCDACGKLEEFPFTPNGLMPVYCNDCFNKIRGK